MSALWTLITPAEGVDGETFAVVADATTAHYVFSDGSDAWSGIDDARVQRLASLTPVTLDSPETWLGLATSNLGYVSMTDPVAAPDIEAATAAAQSAVADAPAQQVEADAGPWQAPQTREELMAFQRAAADQWAEEYPEAASGEVDDPEADLALAQLMTPPVDPTKPHRWLPIATTETDCGFCEQPEDAAIHRVKTDTIT